MEGNGLGSLLPEMRLDFWEALWKGEIASETVLRRRLKVLELELGTGTPCCKCVLRLRHGDAYLEQIWRYGRDRLRVAVGNLLPGEDSGIIYGVCRLTPHHIYILACGKGFETAAEVQAIAEGHVATLIEALAQYLDLESERKEITPINALRELTQQGK